MSRAIAMVIAFGAALLYLYSKRLPTGTIEGTVRDGFGAPIADGSIGVVGLAHIGRGDSLGRYRLPSIPVGTHRLRAEAVGYAPVERDSVVVQRGATTVVDFSLDRLWTWTSFGGPRRESRLGRSLPHTRPLRAEKDLERACIKG